MTDVTKPDPAAPKFYKDSPIKEKDEDKLNLNQYAEALCTFIANSETPLTIGIQGDWGSGKTSLLNLISQRLTSADQKDNYICIVYNSWLFACTSDSIGTSLISYVTQKLIDEARISAPTDPETKKIAVRLILSSVKDIAGGWIQKMINEKTGYDVSNWLENLKDEEIASFLNKDKMEDPKELFNKLICKLRRTGDPKKKIIIMIDDLDRIPPEKVIEITEVIKNFFDVEHCVFLMACDFSVIQKGVIKKLGLPENATEDAKKYFDKIFQVPFKMPSPNDDDLTKFITSDFLPPEYDSDDEDEEDDVQNALKSVTQSNPRALKRLANIIRLQGELMKQKNKEPTEDMLYITLIQQISSDLYSIISQAARAKESESMADIQKIENYKPTGDKKTSSESAYLEEKYPNLKRVSADERGTFSRIMKNSPKLKELLKDKSRLRNILDITDVTSVGSDQPKSYRDYTKYRFNGELYGKGKLVQALVTQYVKDNPSKTYDQCVALFPSKIASFPVIQIKDNVPDKDIKRYFKVPIQIEDKSVRICNQWKKENLEQFLKLPCMAGYTVEPVTQS